METSNQQIEANLSGQPDSSISKSGNDLRSGSRGVVFEQTRSQTQSDQTILNPPLDMGPRWCSEEIEIFFDCFKENGTSWDKIVSELHDDQFSHRTQSQVIAFYEQTKHILNNPGSSLDELEAYLKTHYKNLKLSKKQKKEQPGAEVAHKKDFEMNVESANELQSNDGPQQRNQRDHIMRDESTPPQQKVKQVVPNNHDLGRDQNALAQMGVNGPLSKAQFTYSDFIDTEQNQAMNIENVQKGMAHTYRKPSGLTNRKGLPQKYKASKIVVDEEYLLNQSPQKQGVPEQQDAPEIQIQSEKVKRWFNAEYFYSQMDRAYFASVDFTRQIEAIGLGDAQLSTKEWSLIRQALIMNNTLASTPHHQSSKQQQSQRNQLTKQNSNQLTQIIQINKRKRRLLFSQNFIEQERIKLSEFRQIFREIINLMSSKKDLIKFIFMENDAEMISLKSQILFQLSKMDQEKNKYYTQNQPILSQQDLQRRKEKAAQILEIMREFKIMPISVQQRVLAIHPKTGEQRTARILTAPYNFNNNQFIDKPLQYRAQFDRSELKVPQISDLALTPINIQGANWDIFRQKFNASNQQQGLNQQNLTEYPHDNQGMTLANEIKNQAHFYKVIRDKHDNSQIKILEDVNYKLQNGVQPNDGGVGPYSNGRFVKFEHTKFGELNKKAMSMLIILLHRKNELLKNLGVLSSKRKDLLEQQSELSLLTMQKHQEMYAWLYKQLEYTNRAIAPILTAFRYRSIKSEYIELYEQPQHQQDVVQ